VSCVNAVHAHIIGLLSLTDVKNDKTVYSICLSHRITVDNTCFMLNLSCDYFHILRTQTGIMSF
jgi:hypothetical protein